MYSGHHLAYLVTDLEPACSYNFTVRIVSKRGELHSSCSRVIQTKGERNLLANPSFEELGVPLRPHFNYGAAEFAAYWEPLMMPYSLVIAHNAQTLLTGETAQVARRQVMVCAEQSSSKQESGKPVGISEPLRFTPFVTVSLEQSKGF